MTEGFVVIGIFKDTYKKEELRYCRTYDECLDYIKKMKSYSWYSYFTIEKRYYK